MASHALRLHPLLFSTVAWPVPPKVRAGAQRSRPTLAVVRCSSAAQALKIKSILTNPVEGQKTRTSGLRQKVKMFQRENYLANWIQFNYSSGQPAPETITDQIYGNTLLELQAMVISPFK
ncbi:hypothetical protein E2562_033514 [Oryza meyeriana var. granulata]|uniref:Uncharacterized protein n=1 Tax=Oryza meyeriana var. granulata TaxID=110450 RepID=A0A6G1ED50_9ORYZ|nr:hypothetical protein E2562_033514 [Oryza meyeriana var. granulata]